MDNLSIMDGIVKGIKGTDKQGQVQAIQSTVGLFVNPNDILQHTSVINSLIEADCLPVLIEFLNPAQSDNSQELIAWSVSLLHKISCYGNDEQIKLLADSKIIPPLIALLTSSNTDMVSNTAKTLGNIAQDTSEQRDRVISEGAIQPILYYVKHSYPEDLLIEIAWFLSVLCNCNTYDTDLPLDLSVVKEIMPALNQLLYYNNDDILSHISLALHGLTYSCGNAYVFQAVVNESEHIQAIMNDTDIIQRLVELLTSANTRTDNPEWLLKCIHLLNNISVDITNDHSEALIEAGIHAPLIAQLSSPHTSVAHSAAEALLNICIFGITGIKIRDQIINAGAIAPILRILKHSDLLRRKLLRQVAKFILKLLFDQEQPLDIVLVNQLLPGLMYLIKIDNQETPGHLVVTCLAFYFVLYQRSVEEKQLILNSIFGLFPRLIQFLHHDQTPVVFSALGTIVQMVAVSNQREKLMILADGAVIPALTKLLNEAQPEAIGNTTILACILTSTISKTRATSHIDFLFSHKVVEALLNVLANGDFNNRTNAARAITNIAKGGEQEHIARLKELGAFVPMFSLLQETENNQTILTLLNGLAIIMQDINDENEFYSLFFSLRMNFRLFKQRILNLTTHLNAKIRRKSTFIIRLLQFSETQRL